jgi:hypothetical protein
MQHFPMSPSATDRSGGPERRTYFSTLSPASYFARSILKRKRAGASTGPLTASEYTTGYSAASDLDSEGPSSCGTGSSSPRSA